MIRILADWSWLWPPLHGNGYQFWSGFGSDFGEVAILTAAIAIYRRHQCHVKGCWRLAWHPSEEHRGHPVCRTHHPHAGPGSELG